MIALLKKIFRHGRKSVYYHIVKEGALLVDVRTAEEFQSGHIQGAINIPVEQLHNRQQELPDKGKPIITCCASGMRSGNARSILVGLGYKNVYNGGGWRSLQKKIQ